MTFLCGTLDLPPPAATAALFLALVVLPPAQTHSLVLQAQHPAAALLLALEVVPSAVVLAKHLEVLPQPALPLLLECLGGPLDLLPPAAAVALPLALIVLPTTQAHSLA